MAQGSMIFTALSFLYFRLYKELWASLLLSFLRREESRLYGPDSSLLRNDHYFKYRLTPQCEASRSAGKPQRARFSLFDAYIFSQ